MSGRLENDSFKILDTVVSMNGFHVFLDKQKAFHEIWRVLKPGGDFIEKLVVTLSLLLPILLLTGSNNLLNLALICHNL